MVTEDGEILFDEVPKPGERTNSGIFAYVEHAGDGDTIRVYQDHLGSFGLFLYRAPDGGFNHLETPRL